MSEATRPKRIKIAPNLYRVGSVYRYRRGDDEKVLGQFRTELQAIKARDAHESLRQALGAESFRARLKHAYGEYREFRQDQHDGKIAGRRKLAGGTLKEIDTIWNKHLLQFFGNKFFSDITDPLWEKYCNQATVADLKNHRKVMGGFLRWAKRKGMIRVLPEFEIPAVIVRKRPILTPDQMTALIKNAEGKTLLFIAMYLFMGMRRSEQMHLKWKDVHFADRSLYIHDETTRTRKGRPVPINPFVLNLLLKIQSDQLEAGINTPYVYPKRGQPNRHMGSDSISKSWHTVLRKAGLEGLIEPHDLRATYEYYANKSTAHTDMQREKMAGASIKVQSQRYVTFNADDLRGLEEVVKFAGLENALISDGIPAKSRKADGKKTGIQKSKTTRKSGKTHAE